MLNRNIHSRKSSFTTLFVLPLTILTVLSGIILSSPKASADSSSAVNIEVTVPSSCTLTTNPGGLSATITPSSSGEIGTSSIKALCNDPGGLAIYAIGYTGNIHGDNNLRLEEAGGTLSTTNLIPTNTASSPTTSQWNMIVANNTDVQSPYTPTIPVEFQSTHIVPTTQAMIASYASTTDQTSGVNIKITYNAYIGAAQAAGTYKGKVKYTLVHPSLHAAPASRPATLDTGQTVNAKMKSLAAGSSKTWQDTDTLIKSINVHTETSTPSGFTPSESNTISSSASEQPIYIVFDNTNEAGVIHFYTLGDRIVLPVDSSYMFYKISYLGGLSDLSDWDTSKVNNMNYMFYNAGYSATTFSLDLSDWDTSAVTTMRSMFFFAGYSTTSSFSLDLSDWDTSAVTTMEQMFYQAGRSASTFSLDLSDWDTSAVTNMSNMFDSAGYSATTFSLDLSDWDTSKVQNMNNMFYSAGYNATTWSIGDLSDWDTSKVTNMGSMFSNAGYSATTWSIGDLSNWDTSAVTYMKSMFYYAGYTATTWSIGDLSDWDTSKVTNMQQMFYSAGYNATTFSLDLSDWDTSKVTNMDSMFRYTGNNATAANWSVIIPQTNGNGISNTTSRLYGKTSSTYAAPDSGKSFTLAQ